MFDAFFQLILDMIAGVIDMIISFAYVPFEMLSDFINTIFS
ncbi:hypothetical protein ABQD97_03365 [Enterococcus avium]|uniref:Uncharacterized protein n=1 Tax=Enterococcus avium TaxID=33945 RepID=A0ABD5F6N9_ENTAV|nr:hypothetical protein [Enterococcus avium]MDT2397246.1 hypothetical protein [Enterococcus avium]MDT2435522.1 hypothetical protein [Enterococcus avium]MDT2448097.1 hypothetical protein [Enterococcus avium]MDT2457659.1 hypothetical protein [Enterococcus avium]MDT2464704.1 hypothetical protein [Enterococcus avium]